MGDEQMIEMRGRDGTVRVRGPEDTTVPLARPDGTVGAWQCTLCDHIEPLLWRTPEEVRVLCARCCWCMECGRAPRARESYHCAACGPRLTAERAARAAAHDAARLDAAEKLDASEYVRRSEPGAMVYWHEAARSTHGNEGFFHGVEEAAEWADAHSMARPAYVHGCTPQRPRIRLDHALESACEEMHEDAGSEIPDDAIKEMQAQLDAWLDGFGIVSWFCDDRVAVRVPTYDELPRAAREGDRG